MTLLLAAVAIAILAAAWVVHPILFRRWGLLTDVLPANDVERETKKRVALAALTEVEYDRAAGKLDDTDYRAMRGQLEREALLAVRATGGESQGGAAVEASIEHSCGFANPGGSRYCAGCGKRLG